ncbi:MAG TPA: NAD(P)-dependent oxidoreductase [Spirochaetota bacterium]|nr:NAD(P)-dependent oxidoreductase [Spirochaetota bacterium]
MKRAIVTGANGFIGSALVKELLNHNIEVLAIVRNNHKDALPESNFLKIISLELDQISELKNKVDEGYYDIFYHIGWSGSAGSSRADEVLQLKNVFWTIESLKTAKQIGCKRFVCAGSIMEKEVMALIYTQGNKPNITNIYGACKMTAHCLAKPIANDLNIDFIWAVITNAYGEGELSPRFINTTIRKILNKETLQFTSAMQNYDFVHISDVARAFYCIGDKGKANYEYVIGSSQARPLKEFIIEMISTLAPTSDLLFGNIPYSGINLPLSTFDTADTEKDTGFKALISFSEGIKRTMDWLIKKDSDL